MPEQASVVDTTSQERVDVLQPPTYEPSGEVKTALQAIIDEDWLGTFNIWLYTKNPEPSIIYQMRSPNALWAPSKLDVAAGGHYEAGEQGLDGMREMNEELGVDIPKERVHFFGRKMNSSVDVKGRARKWVISIYDAEYMGELSDMKLQKEEVAAIVRVPLETLVGIFSAELSNYEAEAIDNEGKPFVYNVTVDSFPYNFDDYQRRMAEFLALKLGVSNAYLGH